LTLAHDSDPLLTITDIARELGLRSSAAVSNWRKRYPDFPTPADRSDAGNELFRASEVNAWLRSTGREEIRLNPAESLWQQVRVGGLGRLHEDSVLHGAIAALTIHHLAAHSVERPYGSLRELLGKTVDPHGRLHEVLRSLAIDEPYWRAFEVLPLLAGQTPELLDAIDAVDPHQATVAIDELLVRWTIAAGKTGMATSSSLACLAARLAPKAHQVYDPACGTGNFFTAVLDEFAARGIDPPHITGQEVNASAWSIAVLRLLARDVRDFDLKLGDTLLEDALPGVHADLVVADPPYNQRGWGAERLLRDRRWRHGTPPDRDANTAWLQHALYHLRDDGRAVVLLPLGSLSTGGRVGDIRRSIVAAGAVETIVTLPAGLATFTGIPLALWILRASAPPAGRGQVLLIDASDEPQVSAGGADRALTPEAIDHIAATVTAFREDPAAVEAAPGFSALVTTHTLLADPAVVLTPQQWVAAQAAEGDLLTEQYDDLVDAAERSVEKLRHAGPLRRLRFDDPDPRTPPLALRDLDAAKAVEILRPGRLDKSDYTTMGTPVLTQTALQRDGSRPKFERYIDLEAVGRQTITQAGDVILATIGDRPYAVVEREGGSVLGNNLELLRIHAEWLDPELVAAYLSSSRTARAATGSVMKRVRLRDLSIPAPTHETAAAFRDQLRNTAELERAAREVMQATGAARELLIEAAVAGAEIAEAGAQPRQSVRRGAESTTSQDK
jgi:type I restriction-modification system DNA methylase subunit